MSEWNTNNSLNLDSCDLREQDIKESIQSISRLSDSAKNMGVWKTYKLGDIANVIMGQSPSGDTCNTDGCGTPLLNGPTEFGTHYPFPVQYTIDPKKLSDIDDILFCVRGSTTGRMNWANNKYAIGRGLAAIRHKHGKEYKHFLKGLLDFNLNRLLGNATGSTFPNIGGNQLKDFIIQAPDLPTQRQIAQILTSLDDKIELNLQMNQTLEAMAQAIFKEWFVDFNFPGFDGNLVDELPKGWRIGSVLEIATLLSGGTPKTNVPEYWDGDINWISAKDITSSNNQFIIETEKTITELGIKKSAAKLLPIFTTIISARGTVGNFCILSKKMAISQSNYGLKSNLDYDFFIFLLVKNLIQMMKAFSYGTVFDTITTKTFQEMEIIIPDNTTIEEFEKIIKPIYSKILTNQLQNQSLTQTRNTLLPKLMSGNLEVTL